jgi:hypothetical protein
MQACHILISVSDELDAMSPPFHVNLIHFFIYLQSHSLLLNGHPFRPTGPLQPIPYGRAWSSSSSRLYGRLVVFLKHETQSDLSTPSTTSTGDLPPPRLQSLPIPIFPINPDTALLISVKIGN